MMTEHQEDFELVSSPNLASSSSGQQRTITSPQPIPSSTPNQHDKPKSNSIQTLFDQPSTDPQSVFRNVVKYTLLISIPIAVWWSAATTLLALAFSSTTTAKHPVPSVNPVAQVQIDVDRTLGKIREWIEHLDENNISVAAITTAVVDKVKEYLSMWRMLLLAMAGGVVQTFQQYKMPVAFAIFVLPAYILIALVFPGLAWWFLRKSAPLFWVGVGYYARRRSKKTEK